ncbi:MAG: oligosaccharide flippase family protein [Terriglobales bacterium]
MSQIKHQPVSVQQKLYGILWNNKKGGHFVNSASSVAVRAVSGLTRLGILLAIARTYGPEAFGKLSLAIAMVEILRMFSDFGIDTISIRRFTQVAPAQRAELLEWILGGKLVLAACFYAVAAGALFLLAKGNFEVSLGLIAGVSIFFSNILGAFVSYLQSFFSMSRIFGSTVASSAASVLFASVAIHTKASLLFVIVALPLADALNLILFCSGSDLPLRLKFDFRQTLSLLRESFPVGITSALVILYFRLDTLFVFKFAGAVALGLYSACFRVIEPALMIPSSFSTTAYAVLSSTDSGSNTIRRAMQTVLRTMWPAYTAIGALAVTGLLAGKVFLERFFPMYLQAYPIMMILIFALLARSANMGLTSIFHSRGLYSTITRIAAVNLCVNLILVLLLVEKYGAVGAAWAALLTEGVNTTIQLWNLAYLAHGSNSNLVVGMVNSQG